MITLDVDAVRTFVAVADLQSFTRAADVLGSTQGAISVKLKRLENRVGKKLIERTPRLVRLSAQVVCCFSKPRANFSPPTTARSRNCLRFGAGSRSASPRRSEVPNCRPYSRG